VNKEMTREQITKSELEKIDGLQFNRYQMDWMERMTEIDGWTVKKWIEYVISRVVLSHVGAGDYPTIPDERLKADLIEYRGNKHSDG
jgi:hypothetical protein